MKLAAVPVETQRIGTAPELEPGIFLKTTVPAARSRETVMPEVTATKVAIPPQAIIPETMIPKTGASMNRWSQTRGPKKR